MLFVGRSALELTPYLINEERDKPSLPALAALTRILGLRMAFEPALKVRSIFSDVFKWVLSLFRIVNHLTDRIDTAAEQAIPQELEDIHD